MRHQDGIWNGIWSDMMIETTYMRYGKATTRKSWFIAPGYYAESPFSKRNKDILTAQTRTQPLCSLCYDSDGAHKGNTAISKIKKCCKLLWVRDCSQLSVRYLLIGLSRKCSYTLSGGNIVCGRYKISSKFPKISLFPGWEGGV